MRSDARRNAASATRAPRARGMNAVKKAGTSSATAFRSRANARYSVSRPCCRKQEREKLHGQQQREKTCEDTHRYERQVQDRQPPGQVGLGHNGENWRRRFGNGGTEAHGDDVRGSALLRGEMKTLVLRHPAGGGGTRDFRPVKGHHFHGDRRAGQQRPRAGVHAPFAPQPHCPSLRHDRCPGGTEIRRAEKGASAPQEEKCNADTFHGLLLTR